MSNVHSLNASSRILAVEARRRGYVVTQFNDKHLLRISKGKQRVFTRGSRHSKQSSVGMTIADYKGLTRQIVTSIDPKLMAEGEHFFGPDEGLEFAKKINLPLVFKPSANRHGKGVRVGIVSMEELREVILSYKDYRGYILEKVLSGNDYRIVVVGYKVVAASRRLPAFVDGDGTRAIGELVELENERSERGVGHNANLTKIKVDDLVLNFLMEQGMSLNSVPTRGTRVFLRKTAGLSTGGVGIDVTDEVGEENRILFEKIAKETDLSTVGIDVMADNLEIPIVKQNNAGVLELNASPGLRMHHFPYMGKPRNVAGAILDYLFEKEKR